MISESQIYRDSTQSPVQAVVAGVDKDVERSEDILMTGYALVLMAPMFAPIAPPKILLPLMAVAFVVCVCLARVNFMRIKRRLTETLSARPDYDFSALQPILEVFKEHPKFTLHEGFNPLKNLKRTLKSFLGGLMINPLWMPIFYTLGMQFAEEKQVHELNRAVLQVEKRWGRLP